MKTGIAGIVSILLSMSFVTTTSASPKAVSNDQIIMGEKMLPTEKENTRLDNTDPNGKAEVFCKKDCVTLIWDRLIKEKNILVPKK